MPRSKKSIALPQARDKWYAAGLRFKCTQCGNCCTGGPGYVWVTPEDMERIAAFLHLPLETFTRTFVRKIGQRYSLTETRNLKGQLDCTFLRRADGKAMCGIYPVRPTQCRTWPFWDENLKNPDAWTHAAGRCPGMADADAPLHPLEEIETARTNPENP